jgi:cell division septal protein FtsQ
VTWRHKLVAVLALLAAGAGAYMFWLRDSSLVAVTDVEVVGLTTSERPEVVAALTSAAKEMTTLHPDAGRLREIGARFPTVAGLTVDPNFPHGLRIEVDQRPPRLVAEAGGAEVPIAADGTVLTGLSPPKDEQLPALVLDEMPGSGRLEGEALEQAMIAGAAPDPLLGLIETIDYSEEIGVELTMRGGIELRFGSGASAERKWAAAAAVLADPKLDAATYVDVRVPERPVVAPAG